MKLCFRPPLYRGRLAHKYALVEVFEVGFLKRLEEEVDIPADHSRGPPKEPGACSYTATVKTIFTLKTQQ